MLWCIKFVKAQSKNNKKKVNVENIKKKKQRFKEKV